MINKSKKGFTLIEFLVIIVILAALATVGVIGYVSFKRYVNIESDKTMIKQLNNYSQKYLENDNIEYLSQLGNKLENDGLYIDTITNKVDNYAFAFDCSNKVFFLVNRDNGNSINYILENKYNGFIFVRCNEEINKFQHEFGYSIYLQQGDYSSTINVENGIDIGKNDEIETINYVNLNKSKSVIFNTNSPFTSLNINDSTNSTIKHYGILGKLNIEKCGQQYCENGYVSYAKIEKGNLTVKSSGEIELLYKDAENANDVQVSKESGGIIHHAHADSLILASNKNGNIDLNVTFDYPLYDGETDTTIKHLDGEIYDVEKDGTSKVLQAKMNLIISTADQHSESTMYLVETREYYNSLKLAIDKVNTLNGSTLLILKDCSFIQQINLTRPLVIEANSKKISNISTVNDKRYFSILGGGELILRGNGTYSGAYDIFKVVGSDNEYGTCVIENGIFTALNTVIECGKEEHSYKARLTIEDGTFITTSNELTTYVIGATGSNSLIEIKKGTIKSFNNPTNLGNHGISLSDGATIILGESDAQEGPHIISELSCIKTNGGEKNYSITINNGTYSSSSPKNKDSAEYNDVIVFDSESSQESSIIINGGTFVQSSTGSNSAHIFNIENNGNIKITINDGEFDSTDPTVAYKGLDTKQNTIIINNTSNVLTDEVY